MQGVGEEGSPSGTKGQIHIWGCSTVRSVHIPSGTKTITYLTFPDPPTLAFFGKKARETPKKARVYLFAEPLKSLEKIGKSTEKQGKSEDEKSTEIGKSKGWRVRVYSRRIIFGSFVCFVLRLRKRNSRGINIELPSKN